MSTTGLGWQTWLNRAFRLAAGLLSPRNPLRRWAADCWNRLLLSSGATVGVAVGGEFIRMLPQFRSMTADYEAGALRAFLGRIRPGDTVWDVGANIGVYTVLSARRVGSGGRVVAWEPTGVTSSILRSHLAANGLQERCTVMQAAVNDGSVDSVCFREDHPDQPLSTNRISSDGIGTPVPAESLDRWVGRLGAAPNVVKIDIEGAEVMALRGAERLMAPVAGIRPVFMVAVHPQFLPEFGCRPEELEMVASARGYIWQDLAGRRARPLEYAEYLLVPGENASDRANNSQ